MSRLLGVELSRLAARPAVRWLALAGLVLAALGGVFAFSSSKPMPEAERARVVAEFEAAYAEWESQSEVWYAECVAGEAEEKETDPEADWGCEWALEGPELEHWLWEPTFGDVGKGFVTSILTGLQIIVLMAAVTFVSAEFSTGAIGSWLTFEPRRVRVLLAKIGAAGLAAAPFAALTFLLAVASTYAPFALHGTTGAVSWATWSAQAGRVAIAGVLIAVVGASLATLARHLAAALGVLLTWLVVVEALGTVAYPGLQRWTLVNNLRALVEGGTSYYLEVCTRGETGRVCEWKELPITLTQGSIVLSVATLVLAGLALVVFVRRDVE